METKHAPHVTPTPDLSYTLNRAERKLAEYLGDARHKAAAAHGNHGRVCQQRDASIDRDGAASEIAFCRLFNLYPDMTVDTYESADCVWLGQRVDVKTTRHDGGNLIAVRWKVRHDPADVFALMVGTYPTFRYVGMATAAMLLAADQIVNFGYGDTYALPQRQLLRVVPPPQEEPCDAD